VTYAFNSSEAYTLLFSVIFFLLLSLDEGSLALNSTELLFLCIYEFCLPLSLMLIFLFFCLRHEKQTIPSVILVDFKAVIVSSESVRYADFFRRIVDGFGVVDEPGSFLS
jgi:hypothetical protein